MFHVKHCGSSTSWSTSSRAGRRSRTSSARAPSPRSGPGISPTRSSCWRSSRRRGDGWISAPAPVFPAWCSPSRSPREPARMSIWSRAMRANAPSCATSRGSPARRRRSTKPGSRPWSPGSPGRSRSSPPAPLAPLARLVAWSEPLLKTGTVGLFPKGREVQSELTEAGKSWKFDAELIPSRTDSEARIVRIRSLHERV